MVLRHEGDQFEGTNVVPVHADSANDDQEQNAEFPLRAITRNTLEVILKSLGFENLISSIETKVARGNDRDPEFFYHTVSIEVKSVSDYEKIVMHTNHGDWFGARYIAATFDEHTFFEGRFMEASGKTYAHIAFGINEDGELRGLQAA